MTTYTSVKVPQPLADKIREISERKGYTSVSDFITHAARVQLREELEE